MISVILPVLLFLRSVTLPVFPVCILLLGTVALELILLGLAAGLRLAGRRLARLLILCRSGLTGLLILGGSGLPLAGRTLRTLLHL